MFSKRKIIKLQVKTHNNNNNADDLSTFKTQVSLLMKVGQTKEFNKATFLSLQTHRIPPK